MGDTIGQYWNTLETDEDKRAFLVKLGVRVYVRRGGLATRTTSSWSWEPGSLTTGPSSRGTTILTTPKT